MNYVLIVLFVIIMVLFWIMIHDTTHFEINEYRVTDPRFKKKFRAVLLSDLHGQRYGRDNALLLDAIRKGKPDLVLMAGDMLTARPGRGYDVALDLIRELAKEYPVCYGVGNHEHRIMLYRDIYGDLSKQYERELKACGAPMMHNKKKDFEELGITVVGSQIHHRYYHRRRKTPMSATYLPRNLGTPEESKFTVLLAHNPEYFPEYAAWGADLVLSGHVHGGVARVPFINRGVISPGIKFFPKYDGGIFHEGNSTMILSRGLGCHTIPVRVFNPGDLIFLDFEPGEAGVTKVTTKKAEKKRRKEVGFHGNLSETGKV